ncbi:DUF2750 domain-containing protein [Bacillus sp. M6-12]|uniref:DUF2750 domain-containing protein n=1 Tax=Bacillus sp. M6-12 TaxID=2054166 RepID=UPI000C7792ED|nr:DUF2750 domain-containing protein [Bacillus sp. M6-12]PLS18236.1 DUF2750 domain-containing protein [Bacillus sp. M6-12]
MSPKEFEAVFHSPVQVRYEYFIKRAADFEEVWVLTNEGEVALSGNENDELLLPLWPFKEYAEACKNGEWKTYIAENINIYEFIDEYIISLKEDKIRLSIFFNNKDSAVVETDILVSDLNKELEQY